MTNKLASLANWPVRQKINRVGQFSSVQLRGSVRAFTLRSEPDYGAVVYRAVCLFASQLSLVLTALTYGGMARLS